MLKMGAFYLTTKGRLVKLFNVFPFQDGYTINAAIYALGAGWRAVRYTPDGRCNVDGADNNLNPAETFDKYRKYVTFVVWFDRAANFWKARANDVYGATVVELTGLENEDRALKLLQTGVEQKMLTWMREAGYDDDMKETENVAAV